MRLSQYFLPVLKEKPAEAQITSHSLMLRAGMIRQQVSGIYSWLPLGLKVLQNISDIVRKSMNEAGCIEILMPCIQPADLWRESERYDAYGKEMLRITDRHENELLFGPTAEEVVTDIFRGTVKSYRDLPKTLYNIQWKFRDEIRPRFGVMRGREFLMKDAYSFDISHEAAVDSYNRIYKAYLQTFKNLGLSAIPVRADTGPIGGDLSHEFHIIAETGESSLYYDERFELLADELSDNMELMKSLYAAADEMHDQSKCPIPESKLRRARGIEVGHIFNFGTKYSAKMGATVSNDKGEMVPLEMGSYGIGISRLTAAIIEANHDERGITWPEEMAPFKASILNLAIEHEGCSAISEEVYQIFCAEQIDVLYDDTDARAGQKFATHDLIGSPWQIIVGPKKAEQNLVELKHRRTGEIENLTPEIAAKKVIGNIAKSL